ncbi:hypothetical protein ABOM_001138 [Aspergillus bombycis]|uniref:Protein kinase domain-containing protein n=1 Tax=Aspergillus bombycis TaxID=109264 RepID=A0A1F8AF99_9EURO|nr:hypothetical protein ABOM_001138 [Aspergillus bombycis]OGM50347.1 hypothetical protein ABOM_001138 [Aspergillus bombycis]
MMSLAEAKDASSIRLFQLPIARGIVAQLVQAVVFLHSEGIAHGDLHAGNILIRLPESIDTLSKEQLYERESFTPLSSKRHYSNVLDTLVPPEAHFESETPLSFPSDIWTLACTIWTIIAQQPLFEGFNPSADWWDSRARWFNKNSTRHSGATARPLVQRFHDAVQKPRRKFDMSEIGQEEKTAWFAILHTILAFRPEERLTAVQVMGCEWMQKWALPELARMKIQ